MKKFTQNNHGNHGNLIKIIMLLFCFLLFLPFASFAQFSGGHGTPADPYQIATAADLAQLATYVNAGDAAYNSAHYILTKKIDLAGYHSGEGWTPIGNTTHPFKGNFNGDNQKITNLKIISEAPGATGVFAAGLFGLIDGGSVAKLGIEEAEIIISNTSVICAVGILAGAINQLGKVEHCYTSGFVGCTGSYTCVGGVAGSLANSTISHCYSNAVVFSVSNEFYSYAGGIAGKVSTNGEITHCYSTGLVNSENLGKNTAYAGGITADLDQNCIIRNCYSTATVKSDAGETDEKGTSCSGGLVGGTMPSCIITDCVALNPSIFCKGELTNFGRVAGTPAGNFAHNLAFSRMYNPNGGTSWAAADKNGTYLTAADIIADETFGGTFMMADGWTTQKGKLPSLAGNAIHLPIFLQDEIGNSSYPYRIRVADDLVSLADYTNFGNRTKGISYKLVNDIDLSAYPNWNPIGTMRLYDVNEQYIYGYVNFFSGDFDGSKKKITGLKINNTELLCGIGLFGLVGNGTVKDLFIEEVDIL